MKLVARLRQRCYQLNWLWSCSGRVYSLELFNSPSTLRGENFKNAALFLYRQAYRPHCSVAKKRAFRKHPSHQWNLKTPALRLIWTENILEPSEITPSLIIWYVKCWIVLVLYHNCALLIWWCTVFDLPQMALGRFPYPMVRLFHCFFLSMSIKRVGFYWRVNDPNLLLNNHWWDKWFHLGCHSYSIAIEILELSVVVLFLSILVK